MRSVAEERDKEIAGRLDPHFLGVGGLGYLENMHSQNLFTREHMLIACQRRLSMSSALVPLWTRVDH